MRVALPPLLRRNRPFTRFWAGQTVSLVGDQVTLIALPLLAVLVLGADPAQMGYLTAAGVLPNLLFSLHAGAWLDRRGHRRRAMVAADLGRAALLATIPIAYAAGVLTLAQLYVVAFLVGSLSVVFFVAYNTLFVALVPRDDLVQANSLLHGSRAASFVAGPSIGGALVQAVSAPAAIAVDAASYLVSAGALGGLEAEEPPTEEAEAGHVVAGARYIAGSAVVRSALLATATINLFNFVYWAIFVLFATRSLHVRPGTLGLLLGAASFGGLLGAVVTGRVSRRIGVGPAFLAGCVVFTAPLMLVPLAGGPRPVVLGMLFAAEFLSGLGVMMLDISAGVIFQAVVPDRLRARVSGAYLVVNYGVRSVGSVAGGLSAAAVGLRPTLWVATAGATLGFLWLLPSPITRMRSIPTTAEM